MRLVDHLASRRQLYPRPLATMPDVLLIDVPPVFASPSLPLGRFYPVILETDAEYAEMAAFIEMDRVQIVVPNLFDRRLSALRGDDIVFARYAPPSRDWPWVLLCRWPAAYVAMVPQQDEYFARGAYTSECFRMIEELVEAERRLFATLGSDRVVQLTNVSGVMGQA